MHNDIDSITTEQMNAWYVSNVHADNASIYVGGDTTLAEVLPLLEARFADIRTSEDTPDLPSTTIMTEEKTTTVIVDSPVPVNRYLRWTVCIRTYRRHFVDHEPCGWWTVHCCQMTSTQG